mgnify:CR=1 FL=1
MKIKHDEEIELIIERIENGKDIKYECSYIVVSYHRNNSLKDKSLWTIDEELEINCFKESQEKNWVQEYTSWGVDYESIKEKVIIKPIGNSVHNEELKIGRFIDSGKNNTWHGYPANYRRKKQDIPPTDVLLNWVGLGILKKHQVIKIKQQKKCNL